MSSSPREPRQLAVADAILRATGTPSTSLAARYGIPAVVIEHVRKHAGLDPLTGAPVSEPCA